MLAQRIIPELESKAEPTLDHDSSTNNLIRRYRKRKHRGRGDDLRRRKDDACNSE